MRSNLGWGSLRVWAVSCPISYNKYCLGIARTLNKEIIIIVTKLCKPQKKHTVARLFFSFSREVVCNRFAHMFLSYEHFVILGSSANSSEKQPPEDPKDNLMSLTPQQQETQQNFDKTSFLSDQKQSHLAFLSSFLETQMFSTFIDECIVKISSDTIDEAPFEVRLNALKGKKKHSRKV